MGLFEQIIIQARFKTKLAEKILNSDEPCCRFCGSTHISYSKTLGYGDKMGKVFHYKLSCESCGKSYFVKKTKEVFEKVKNIPWNKSNNYLKNTNRIFLNK